MNQPNIVWFMDIDGVLNAFNPNEAKQAWNTDTINTFTLQPTGTQSRYRMNVIPEVVEKVNDLLERFPIELRWLTTWEHDANLLFAPKVGLRNDFEVCESAQVSPGFATFAGNVDLKTMFIQEAVSDPTARIIWTEDCIPIDPSIDVEELLQNPRLCPIRPNDDIGLSPNDFIQIENWLKETVDA